MKKMVSIKFLGLGAVICLGLAGCSTPQRGPSPQPGEQLPQVFSSTVSKPVRYDYLAYVPETRITGSQEKFPLILFLHGLGERGSNVWKVAVHGPPKLIKNGKQFPFIVISPQCPLGAYWDAESVVALLDDVCNRYSVDRDRVYLTGLSMGGFGSWDLIARYPERFAAAAPICGGGSIVALAAADKEKSAALKRLPIWAFHGAKDNVVALQQSEDMVNRIAKGGGNAKLTVYPEATHDSWTATYDNPELYDWFLKHDRKTNVMTK
jgi:predicted peptidase